MKYSSRMRALSSSKAARKTDIRSAANPVPVFRFRLRITAGKRIAVGPGKVALLEAIRATGSLTAAAKSLEMSYRRAWLLLDELNKSLETPAVESAQGGEHGGGSRLTPVGEQLVAIYRRIEGNAAASNARDIKRLLAMLAD
jgi:molybdate transport system regulatory protein